MKKQIIIISIAIFFVSGFFLAKSLFILFIVSFVFGTAALYSQYFFKNKKHSQINKRETTRFDEPSSFVKEEVYEGKTDTSLNVLSLSYKRKIRHEIEQVIIDTLGYLMEILKFSVPYYTLAVFRRGHSDSLYLFMYNSDSENVLLGETINYGVGLVGQVMSDNEGKRVYEGDIRSPSTTLLYYSRDESIKTLMAVPIKVDNICRGVVVIDSKEKNAFNDDMKYNIDLFAKIAGRFQYYSYLQLENRIDRNKVTALSSFQGKFFKLQSENEIIKLLGQILETFVQSDRITVSLLDSKEGFGIIRFVKGIDQDYFNNFSFPLSEKGMISLVFEQNIVVSRRFERGRYVPRFSVREKVNDNISSILAVPISSSNEEKCIGVISLESKYLEHYTQVDYENVSNLANSVSLALEKINMLKTQIHLATIDGLTRLPNHREFQNKLESKFKRAKRQKSELAVILTDIDHFKKVNDTYGHPAGDQILKGVSDVIKKCIRKDVDFAARYGGEEFACIIESGLEKAFETAERIRSQIEAAKFSIGIGKELNITMSFGVAVFPKDAKSKQALVEKADKALYEAKNSGRNRVKKY